MDWGVKLVYVEPEQRCIAGLLPRLPYAERQLGGEPRRLHYRSVPPGAADEVVRTLGQAGLAARTADHHREAVGTDPHSARALNASLHSTFAEEQIFRIDHFLGKEAALNILAFRFANGLFEPIWNRCQIGTMCADRRSRDPRRRHARQASTRPPGAYRDMVVTHLFQVLGVHGDGASGGAV